MNENDIISTIIREELEMLDKYLAGLKEQTDESGNNLSKLETKVPTLIGNQHVSLDSPLPASTISFVEHCMFGRDNDTAFRDFRKKLSKSLSMIYGRKIRLSDQQEVCTNYHD